MGLSHYFLPEAGLPSFPEFLRVSQHSAGVVVGKEKGVIFRFRNRSTALSPICK